MYIRVELLDSQGNTHELGSKPTVVPAGSVVLAVHGASVRTVRLDGVARGLSAGGPGLLAVDLTRSTGYHRLEVAGSSFWFATQDGKLRLDGVAELLRDLEGTGTSWSGQIIFSDGAILRDPHVVFGWLDQRCDGFLGAAAAINRAPVRATTRQRRLQRHGGGGIDVPRTLALLRSRPREYLAEHESGQLEIDETRYEPLRVVATRRTTTLATPWNRRFVALIDTIQRLVQEVLASDPSPAAIERCQNWAHGLSIIAAHPTAQEIRRHGVRPSDLRAPTTTIETSEPAYRMTCSLARDLGERLGWLAKPTPLSQYSYVAYADEVYQAWAAAVLATALGLEPTHSTLGAAQPAFRDDRMALYYDTEIPSTVLRSWRHGSNTPDHLRPDLVLVDEPTGRVSLLDVKYRNAESRATEDSRKEVLAYMASYGLEAVGIVYPPAGNAADVVFVAGSRHRIVEIPLKPGVVAHDAIRDTLLGMMSWASY